MKTSTIAMLTAAGLVTGGLGYLIYFDHKRRNDPKFRKKLRRDRNKAIKAAESQTKRADLATKELAGQLVKIVSKEKLPASPEEKEKFFMAQVAQGEVLAGSGPSQFGEAACCFYRALKVYPNPIELIMIYQKTVPEALFGLVMAMMAEEVKFKQERYFDNFPPKKMNIEVKDKSKKTEKKEKSESKDVLLPQRGLFALKDIEEGEVIYEEDAVVSTLLPDEDASKEFCHHCQKPIEKTDNVEGAHSEETVSKEEAAIGVDEEATKTEEAVPEKETTLADEEKPETEEAVREETEDVSITEPAIDATREEAEVISIPESTTDADAAVAEESTEVKEKEETPENVAAATTTTEEKDEEKPTVEEDNNAATTTVTEEAGEEKAGETEAKFETTEESQESKKVNPNAFECEDCHEVVYCSEKCRTDAHDAYHQVLCTSSKEAASFVKQCRESNELAPIIIAKFFSTLIDKEKKKELARAVNADSKSESDDDEYTTYEHLERLKYLEIIPSKDDAVALKQLSGMLASKIPGLGDFINEERYVTLKGKLAYNTFATKLGSSEKVAGAQDKAIKDHYRTDSDSEHTKGLALYLVTAYLNHACKPNTKLAFPENTSKVALVAIKSIKKGDELFGSYINNQTDRPYESRSKELIDKFRLKCECALCESERE
ncbi:mitochondrial import receptor subunit tom20 [Mycoemilia scoparia]|uniref:Histone-lysine N-methyltransferase SET5 n=1 Tax=Mycoemilia scoparia TaxID=417184 RepID=A0A9W8A2F4_9FUNG|nr:mitochondrial import receptor subunit tom20 [Mycoemilia scoparia]